MTSKRIIWILLSSSLIGILGSAIYHRFLGLFFYSVFLGSITTTILSYFLMRTNTRKTKDPSMQKFLVVSTATLLTFSFLSTIPLTLDRSYSVWVLKNLRNYEVQNQKITEKEIIQDSVKFFSPAEKELNRRLSEQIRIGNIEQNHEGEIKLTNKGTVIAELNSFIAMIYKLNPKYTKLDK